MKCNFNEDIVRPYHIYRNKFNYNSMTFETNKFNGTKIVPVLLSRKILFK